MERSLDYKGRWRNHTVAFRVSDEEAKLLNDLVALSGLTKQELEDDYARLQRRLSGMFGIECADNLYFATQAKGSCGVGSEKRKSGRT